MPETLFNEEQKFNTPWIWLVIFPALVSLIFLLKYNKWNWGEIDIYEKYNILSLIILGGAMEEKMMNNP